MSEERDREVRGALRRYAQLEIEQLDLQAELERLGQQRRGVREEQRQLRENHSLRDALNEGTGSVAVRLEPNVVVTLEPQGSSAESQDLRATVARRLIGTES